jgi:hypothetical protein
MSRLQWWAVPTLRQHWVVDRARIRGEQWIDCGLALLGFGQDVAVEFQAAVGTQAM